MKGIIDDVFRGLVLQFVNLGDNHIESEDPYKRVYEKHVEDGASAAVADLLGSFGYVLSPSLVSAVKNA